MAAKSTDNQHLFTEGEGDIPDELICPICYLLMSSFRKPMTIFPCGHTICADCAIEVQKKVHAECPLCHGSILGTAINFTVSQIIDRLVQSGISIPNDINPEPDIDSTPGSSFYSQRDLMDQKPPPELCEYCQTGATFQAVREKWECKTCGLTGRYGICAVCARHCHHGHDIVNTGPSTGFFCDCSAVQSKNPRAEPCRCCAFPQATCTRAVLGNHPVHQQLYACKTCRIAQLCVACAKNCHANHTLQPLGNSTFCCMCPSGTCASIASNRPDRCTFCHTGPNPVRQPMFFCQTCSLTTPEKCICEACARRCHSSHRVVSVGPLHSFCHCQNDHVNDHLHDHVNDHLHDHTNDHASQTCQLRGREEVCTFAKTGQTFVTQDWWHCEDCGLVGSEGCCAVCARKCHAGHKLVYGGKTCCYCDCGAGAAGECKCCTPQQQLSAATNCTASYTGNQMVLQKFYKCRTCWLIGNEGCCEACAKRCHRGHKVDYEGFVKCFCDCGSATRALHCKCQPHSPPNLDHS